MSENALLSLIQNRTGDFCALFAHLRGSALQPLPQCTATLHAVHCIPPRSVLHPSTQVRATLHASTCIRPRKYLQPSPQVRATVLAGTCGKRPSLRNLFPPSLLSGGRRYVGTKKERANHWVGDSLSDSVGLPGLEPGKAGPESAVLPLHHSPRRKKAASRGHSRQN